MADPISLAAMGASAIAGGGMGMTALGGVVGAVGSIFSGFAKSSMYNYQAAIADMNARIAKQNSVYEFKLGETQAQTQGMKTRSIIGQTRATQGASGLDIGSGSALSVRASEAELGAEDQAMIRSNAAFRAYNDRVIAAGQEAQAGVDRMAASNSELEGFIGATSSVLGAGSSVSDKWLKARSMGIEGF